MAQLEQEWRWLWLSSAEPSYKESTQELDVLTAHSVLLVRDEATKVGELEETRARLANTLALAEDGLRKQALAKVEEERDRELSVL